jgi:hypothetical protein
MRQHNMDIADATSGTATSTGTDRHICIDGWMGMGETDRWTLAKISVVRNERIASCDVCLHAIFFI